MYVSVPPYFGFSPAAAGKAHSTAAINIIPVRAGTQGFGGAVGGRFISVEPPRTLHFPAARPIASLPLEGTGFEPSVPLLRKALPGVANRRRRHERQGHLQVQARDGNACFEWLPIAFPFAAGPRVRIRLPPPVSPPRADSCRGFSMLQ